MPEVFSDSEKQTLLLYCSNTDKSAFVLKNLPESVKGALFSRYSRSTKSLRRLLLDEFIQNKDLNLEDLALQPKTDSSVSEQKADEFYRRVLDGFGDDSVGELGGCHLAIENISNLATKLIEDRRLGGSPLEKSSRYVFFDQKIDGDYLFYKEPRIMASRFADDYLAVNRLLFGTYSRLVNPLSNYFEERFPIENFSFAADASSREEKKFPEIRDAEIQKRATLAYKASLRAKTCDVLRYFLPVSTLTNMGVYGNGRFYEYLLRQLYSSPLSEMNGLAKVMHAELGTTIGPFVRRAKADDFLIQTQKENRMTVEKLVQQHKPETTSSVTLVDFDTDAEEKVLAPLIMEFSSLSFSQAKKIAHDLSETEKEALLKTLLGKRRTRRDKPSRSFENTSYTFDLLGDYGMYRDLQRHRVLTQTRQLITVDNGFDIPKELGEAGFENDFTSAMNQAAELFQKIRVTMPLEAQYVVPFAYKIRWYMKMNLREAFHFIELRSQKQGHSSYRRMTQQMFREIQKVHPHLAALLQFVDLNDYDLSRLESEMKTLNKRLQKNA